MHFTGRGRERGLKNWFLGPFQGPEGANVKEGGSNKDDVLSFPSTKEETNTKAAICFSQTELHLRDGVSIRTQSPELNQGLL